jgi:DNA-binding NtrC family response regulator
MTQPALLSIVELGGYPDLSPLYRQHGFDVTTVVNTRKALSYIKHHPVDVIVAEFIFSPTYGSQLSNFEALLASAQRYSPRVKIIALYDAKDFTHLMKVSERFPLYNQLPYPIDQQQLEQCLLEAHS